MELCNFPCRQVIINIYFLKYIFDSSEGMKMKYTDAQKEATARYNKKTYDRIDLVVKKGQRQVLKEIAASQGKSLNRFILDAVETEISRIGQQEK